MTQTSPRKEHFLIDVEKELSLDHSCTLEAVIYYPPKDFLIFTDWDSNIYVYTFSTRERVAILSDHQAPVYDLQIYSHYLISSSWDHSILVFDLNKMEVLQKLSAHLDYVRAILICHDDGTLWSGCDKGRINIWKRKALLNKKEGYSRVKTTEFHTNRIYRFRECKEYNAVISSSEDLKIVFWDKHTFEMKRMLDLSLLKPHLYKCIYDFVIYNKEIVVGMNPGRVVRYEFHKSGGHEKFICEQLVHGNDSRNNNYDVRAVLPVPNCRDVVFTCSSDHDIILWNTQSKKWKKIETILIHKSSVQNLAIIGDYLVSTSWDGKLKGVNIRDIINKYAISRTLFCNSELLERTEKYCDVRIRTRV